MYLASVEIKNFRGVKDLKATFSDGLNVIVGRNNVGKTNLLTAIMHALGPAATRGESLWISRDDFHVPSRNAEPMGPISITLTFCDLSENQRSAFFEIVDFDLANPKNSIAHIHFQASWDNSKGRVRVERWGGKIPREGAQVSPDLLESLPVTFLPALRDAESALVPGNRSRLARLLADFARQRHQGSKDAIVSIFQQANEALLGDAMIKSTKNTLTESTMSIAGNDYSESGIVAAEANFERILRTLSIQMLDGPTADLYLNGLGYNNLLYIAVVLAHLKAVAPEDCPLLLVEEPEAHLHPQLTTLLGTHLANAGLQTIVTTHSPVLAASVLPRNISVFHKRYPGNDLVCQSLSNAGMDPKEERALARMLDVTRASLYFAKGVILVEGISEAMLLPELARRLEISLAECHISVVPIAGVAFETFLKLFQGKALAIPVAIVTDADPKVVKGETWNEDDITREGSGFPLCDRTEKLKELFNQNASVKVLHSEVTLEYDLAKASHDNGSVMVAAWADGFAGTPGTFTAERLGEVGNDLHERALCAWRGICRSSSTGSKAEFAQNLAYRLSQQTKAGNFESSFVVPKYIEEAIQYVVTHLSESKDQTGKDPADSTSEYSVDDPNESTPESEHEASGR